MTFCVSVLLLINSLSPFTTVAKATEVYDLVVLNGRVIDPETRSDSVRNLGISNGSIKIITRDKLNGRSVIDARGLVVAPGFIDLHAHLREPGDEYKETIASGAAAAAPDAIVSLYSAPGSRRCA